MSEQQAKPGYIADALTCLIRSGSTNGVEKSRKEMLAMVPLFAAAPETAAERDRLKEINAELLAALKLAEKNAAARLYMLPVKTVGADRAALETELATYRAAIAKGEGR